MKKKLVEISGNEKIIEKMMQINSDKTIWNFHSLSCIEMMFVATEMNQVIV